MFSLASKLLSTIATPAFEKAYEKSCSIWEAKDELRKLQRSIQTIQAVLFDAEKKQEASAAIKDWVERVKDVLYDADDLFDEVATDEMLKQQIIKEDNPLKKVRAYCFKLNPVVSRNSIANQVKAIRKSLLEISNDMVQYNFVNCPHEEHICGVRQGQDPGSFVDSKNVIGRDKDKKEILELLLHDQSDDVVSVIAIVGIGGMGKTTFAQLVYNDDEVKMNFQKRWFTCISDTSDDKEVIGKIFQSVCEKKNYGGFNLSQQQERIRGSFEGKKFFLVLDDVWDNDRSRWIDRMGLFSGCEKGSKIIVTTRSLEVASAVGATIASTHTLKGLSEDESWDLFKKIAFTAEREHDSRWIDLGRTIVKKCANVPLAIKSIGSLLHAKATIQEWESIMKGEPAKVGQHGQDPVMSVLKLSYDHLHSNLKQCFAYCSLFSKDYEFDKQDLIYLWIAQGYIKTNSNMQTVEDVGHSYFMDLFRMSFFQEATYDEFGEIRSCKMHDLIHDLAQQVAAEESIVFPTSFEIKGKLRHASVDILTNDSSANLKLLLNGNRLRSLFFIDVVKINGLVLDQEFPNLKFLRTLRLPYSLRMGDVPSSIGELKLLRYLDLSRNTFKRLPNSITKLLNLCKLDLSGCDVLEALPIDLEKLVNLKQLKIRRCNSLSYVPPGFRGLASLQHLDEFRTQRNSLSELFGLKIRGDVDVIFGEESDDDAWNGVECWQPLINLQGLSIRFYNGMRIPHWVNRRSADNPFLLLPNLRKLFLFRCDKVKCLPPFRHLPNLKFLTLLDMCELQYIEENEENGGKQDLKAGSDELFLPYFKSLQFMFLPKLKGWSRRVEAALTRKDDVAASACALLPSFPSLSTIQIIECEKMKYMPLCPHLRVLVLDDVDAKVIPQLLSIVDHYSPSTSTTSSSSSLQKVKICNVDGLVRFPGQSLTSLQYLKINHNHSCERLELPPRDLNILEHLVIQDCPELEKSCWELEKWEEETRSVDWDSLRNLRKLWADNIPSSERLPECLRNLQSQGQLQINEP